MKKSLDFKKILRAAQEKVTPVRVHILKLLSEESYPLSIKEINTKITHFDQSTLYRTLTTLVSKGLVREIMLEKSTTRYEISVGREHHHHITCTHCGLIEDIHGCPKVKNKKFAAITDHRLEFFGTCKLCIKK